MAIRGGVTGKITRRVDQAPVRGKDATVKKVRAKSKRQREKEREREREREKRTHR